MLRVWTEQVPGRSARRRVKRSVLFDFLVCEISFKLNETSKLQFTKVENAIEIKESYEPTRE